MYGDKSNTCQFLEGDVSDDILEARAALPLDFLVRDFIPTWLRLAGMEDGADRFSALPEIKSLSDLPEIKAMQQEVFKDVPSPEDDRAYYAIWEAAHTASNHVRMTFERTAEWSRCGDGVHGIVGAVARDFRRITSGRSVADSTRALERYAIIRGEDPKHAWEKLVSPTIFDLQYNAHHLIEKMRVPDL